MAISRIQTRSQRSWRGVVPPHGRRRLVVLVVEDDPHIGQLVTAALREADYQVELAADGLSGLNRFCQAPVDLLVLDLMLPGLDGFEICRRIRARNRFTPILILTAKASKHDVIRGLELGADDYITKPFYMAEFLARTHALFRRVTSNLEQAAMGETEAPLRCGPMIIDVRKREVRIGGRPVGLTAKEFDLLLQFALNSGKTFTRAELLRSVWGTEFEGYDHTVNTHINRLRTKIEPDPSRPRFIETVWGIGYRFAEMPPP
jgi:DNA-binding response OmpR family regulator